MQQQHKFYLLWRREMLGRMAELPSVQASDKHARADILHADEVLKKEVALFSNWRRNTGGNVEHPLNVPEWSVIERYWWSEPPPSSISTLFERYVHDSRAGFKPFGKDLLQLHHEMDQLAERARILEQKRQARQYSDSESFSGFGLTTREAARLEKYLAWKKQHPDAKNQDDALDPQAAGQEPLEAGGGYLRFRIIYMGSDAHRQFGPAYASQQRDFQLKTARPAADSATDPLADRRASPCLS